jgi:hypothetical protein
MGLIWLERGQITAAANATVKADPYGMTNKKDKQNDK